MQVSGGHSCGPVGRTTDEEGGSGPAPEFLPCRLPSSPLSGSFSQPLLFPFLQAIQPSSSKCAGSCLPAVLRVGLTELGTSPVDRTGGLPGVASCHLLEAWVMGHWQLDLWFELLTCVFVVTVFAFSLFFKAGGLGIAVGLGLSSRPAALSLLGTFVVEA